MSKRICPACSKRIFGHPNKRFCDRKCKDRYHNAQPHRIARTRDMAGSGLLAMIERAQQRGRLVMVGDPDEERCPPWCTCQDCVMSEYPEQDW